jgi:hypothetical protein
MVTPSGYAKSGTITGGSSGGNTGSGTTTPDDDNTGSGSGTTTPTTQYTSIATLHASAQGTSATAKGVVIATSKTGFMFNDGTGSMYFYTNNNVPNLAVGDEVEISGATSEFGGAIQFSSQDGATYTKKNMDVPAYKAPTPTVWDSDDLDAYTGKVGQYVKITADVYTKDKYTNATVTGATKNNLSLVTPSDSVLGSIKLSSTPQTLVITGYTCYLSGTNTKYAYLIVTSISLPGEDVEEEQPTPDTPINPDDNTGGNTGNEDNQGGNTGNEDNQGNEGTTPAPMPDVPSDLLGGMNCSGSISGGLTVMSLAIGAVALLLKKKED